MNYSGGHVSKSQASWAGEILQKEKANPGSQTQKDINTAEKIWSQWKKQGEKE